MRALRAVRRATVVAAPCTDVEAPGRAETIVREAAPDVVIERLAFVMAPRPSQRAAALEAAAKRIHAWLDAGEEVAFVTLGDPNVYSTFSSIAERIGTRSPATPIVTVPGVMAIQELAARSRTVLTDEHQSLVMVPAHHEEATAAGGPLATALADDSSTVVIYKGGRRVPAIADRS